MTRGRCGSLSLHRKALSSSPPRRFIPAFLFISKSNHGVDTHRPPRRDVASEKRDEGQQYRGGHIGQWIAGGHAKEQIANKPRQRGSRENSRKRSSAHNEKSLAKNHF